MWLGQAVWPAVRDRCSEQGDPEDWWSKGFGYSLCLSDFPACRGDCFSVDSSQAPTSTGRAGELRLLFGLYQGCGGPVESMGVVLRRPEDRFLGAADTLRRSKTLWELGRQLTATDAQRSST